MRILHVHGSYYQEGGAETYLRSLIEAQQADGHEPAILYADKVPPASANTCPVYFCRPSHGLRSGWRVLPEFKKTVTAFSPDLIHLHVVQYNISPVVLRWLAQVCPTVMTVHDTLTLCPKPVMAKTRELTARILPDGTPCTLAMGIACLKTGCLSVLLRNQGLASFAATLVEKLWRRRLCHRIDRLIVNSDFTRSDLVRNHIPATRIDVIPVPLNIPAEWDTAGHAHPAETPHLLFVGQLSTIKGASDFVAALAQINDLPWQAGMVGDGPERPQIETALKTLDLDRRVTLHGYVARKNLADHYRQATMLVFPTFAPESLGLVGIEAMWFGLPVVAYDVGAIREWLQHGKNGYLVNPGEVHLLAERIRSLLGNRPQLERFRHQAAETARQWLAVNRSENSFNELYLKVIEEKHAHRH